MRNESGVALVMVMGILAILSLLALGLLHQSRSDTVFTRAITTSQHSFGLADSGISVALGKLNTWSKEIQNEKWTGQMILKKLSLHPIKTPTGTYEALGYFKGYDKSKGTGWDSGSFYNEFWLLEGRGDSTNVITIIDAAVIKINKTNYGDY